MLSLKGIFPPLPTSFDNNEDVATDKIKSNIKDLLKCDLAGILVLGSNGELVMLSEKEKEMVYSAARDEIPGNKLMIAGTGAQSTRETVSRTKMAALCGADAALVLNPSYYRGQMTTGVLVRHYHSVADSSDIPIIIYNMPANSGIDMDADQILAIADHPNIIGLKDSGGNLVKMASIINRAPDDFQVLAGSASFLFPALSIGAVGGILALANIAPDLCIGIRNAFLDGDMELAKKLQFKAVEPNTAVTRRWGIPALKAAMDYLGMYGGPVRKPLLSIDDDIRQKLIPIIDTLNH
jgi:4-hydroxy-2-oxoglutarate aldolase